MDILVNNAGILVSAPLLETDPSHARALIDTNVMGVVDMTQARTRPTQPLPYSLYDKIPAPLPACLPACLPVRSPACPHLPARLDSPACLSTRQPAFLPACPPAWNR